MDAKNEPPGSPATADSARVAVADSPPVADPSAADSAVADLVPKVRLRLILKEPTEPKESERAGADNPKSLPAPKRPRGRPRKNDPLAPPKKSAPKETSQKSTTPRKATPKQPPKPAMAHGAEDCATVLEQFVHDAANLPLEMNHLMEEIQAKDKIMQECRATINSRDGSIQKFIKLNGSLAPNPKEEAYNKAVLQSYERAIQLQDEKIALADKAAVLLDRTIKRLDVQIRELVNEGALSNDPPLPSLFDNKNQYRDPPKVFFPDSTPSDSPSYATPLNPTSGNANPILAAAQRLNQATTPRVPGPVNTTAQGARSSAPATPAATAAVHLQQRQRESSAGAVDTKRRRLNASLGTLPAASSNLRQSSLGPGTPKAGTPAGSRAGSVGPRAVTGIKKALTKKVAPHQQVKKIKASAASKHTKRSSSASGRIKASKKSPAGEGDEDDDSMLSSADMSDSDKSDVADEDMEDDEDEDEGAEDTKVYCTCRTVSHGDMVACDNDSCPYEWFHWKCVGLTREPVGTWYCDECRKTLGK
ncbi:Zinc finger PHD-type [Penicillium subrubescens]|uniref:Chromatin modification-related protein n=1 Tax=Penicillium subrubescens TaxID=1316194 RepID=A0A1Q5UQ46_9EURO|nr:Zinc finger PHD-type [Penicillium subrubescens]KAJ5890522.1 Zinc finger PHD-type [Penicillium subrubescens]OKP14592.1 Chromatin modification-related protein YNG2 [Penicillium subrubescens]